MQLKKIELQGFKSFADKTEIVFLDGITTIVGPNGSGKSNISDALRWVLGEQSVKTLRGAKMEDVIFAGTQARKKVGFAEVSMYLDNTDSTLPVEYKEVVVTRRVYRTGESNYLINNNECRLKDIQELFMDTGVGKDGYSIISQGKIDEILSSKSEERRHIFEEASGIVKYRTRKEEASKKLANTDITLNRVSDILAEIENIIGPLEQKAETAKKYLALRDRLKAFDVKLFIQAVEENATNLEKLEDMIATLEQDIEAQSQASITLEHEKLAIKDRLQDIQQKIEETQNKYYEMQAEAEHIRSDIALEESANQHSQETMIRLKEEMQEDNDKITLLQEEIQKRLEKRKSMSENKVKFEQELAQKQEELNTILLTIDEKGLTVEGTKQEIDAASDRKYELKVDISSMDATIEANQKNQEERQRIQDKTISGKDALVAEQNDISMEVSKRNKALREIVMQLEEKNALKATYLKEQEEKNVIKSTLKQEIMTSQSRYQYLTNLQKENEGYYKSVKEALQFSKENQRVYGTLASLIATKDEYEYAIEIALGGYIQNIVVESEQEAKNIIAYLKQNALGRATFLPLTNLKQVSFDIKHKVAKCEGYIGVASDLVSYDPKFQKAVALSLGTTVIVDTIDHAIAIAKQFKNAVKIVTLAGELLSTSGSMTGGQTTKTKSGLIGRTEKIQKLKEEIQEKEKTLESFITNSRALETSMIEVEAALAQLKEQHDTLQIELATWNQKQEHALQELQRIENSQENNQKVIAQLQEENEVLMEKIKIFEAEIANINQENAQKQVIVDQYARFHQEKQQEIDFLNEDIVNLKISLSSFDESVASMDEMKEKIEQDIHNFEFAMKRKEEQIKQESEKMQARKEKIAKMEVSLQDQFTFKDEYASLSEKLKQSKEEMILKEDNVEKQIALGMKQIEQLKEEKAKIETKKVKFDLEMENVKNKMWDDYELTINSAKKLLETIPQEDMDDKQLAKKAEEIRKEMKGLGEVNLSSIEEYQTTKERYDFIQNQKQDLEETKTKLNNLIANMTSIMKNQFSKQFQFISANFNETFQELFGGGKAELRLADENNILESGIEIEVQPPGKKLQSMMLLSGGERALTATALLFAILKLKSPPFCILDEIEAALDDVNVHRFAAYIKKYSHQTQFIVITHRKGTMEVASSTYGVTMQEYGISKIVSMKLK